MTYFFLQTITENDIKNSLIQQQRQRQIESTKAVSQNIGSDLDSIMARLQMLARSAELPTGETCHLSWLSLSCCGFGYFLT
jgi:hypothetical protein